MVYGPELGMAQLGTTSDLENKLLWLMNEAEDHGTIPQPLVLPAGYVTAKETKGKSNDGFLAAQQQQLLKPATDANASTWEVMRLAPIPPYLAPDAIAAPVEAADILERVMADANIGTDVMEHAKRFLLTAFVKQNKNCSARLENTDFLSGLSQEAAVWQGLRLHN